MKLRTVVMGTLLFSAVTLSSGHGETYSWADEELTVHFTDDLGDVPKKIRKKVKRMDGDVPALKSDSAPVADSPVTGAVGGVAPADAGKGETRPGETYAGRTYDQWKKDLGDREATMIAVRKRIDEIAALLKSPATRMGDQQKLMDEHAALVKQFKDMRAEYDRQVEAARK